MSPAAEAMFMERVYPTIVGTVTRSVMPIGSEDVEELVQDTAVSACHGIESLEARGKEIHPSSVAWYAIQRAKSGRRSMSASRRDVLAPGTALDGDVSLMSLDQPVEDDMGDEAFTLHDAVADRADDPATIAMRHIDWAQFWAGLDDKERYVVQATAVGDMGIDQAKHLGMTPAGVVYVKRRVANKARAFWGDGILADLSHRPAWLRARDAA